MTVRDAVGVVFAVLGTAVALVLVNVPLPLPLPLHWTAAAVGTLAMARGAWIVMTPEGAHGNDLD